VATIGKDPLDTRIVAVRLPDGETEYWMTEARFSVGETVWSRGRRWIVAHIAGPRETGAYPQVSLREESEDEESDRRAWSLPAV
jgi:hypothetical protein